MRLHTKTFILTGALLALPACGGDDDGSGGDDGLPTSTRNELNWKRYKAVEADLSTAMALTPDELCIELGQFNCIREVHLTSMGGHNPFEQGLYEPLDSPLVTTSLALDRIVLSACSERIERDAGGGAEVFTTLDLGASAPDAASTEFNDTVQMLYRRLLARDPLPEELEVFADLRVDADGATVSGADFALAACYAVGTTTEFLFF